MRILIATGIYPPAVGGPSQYAKNVKLEWEKKGHKVKVKTFYFERVLPTGFRHIYYFLKIIPTVLWCDFIFALDTFSVGWPATCAGRLFGKKIIIRTGGDFLWEQYVERTSKKVLLRNFYKDEMDNLSKKEKMIFNLTKWTLNNVSRVIFSTEWQRGIFIEAYSMEKIKTSVIENYFGPKEADFPPQNNTFIASSRNLVWKNLDMLKIVFNKIKLADLFLDSLPFDEFMNKINSSYAIILASLGDVSPNLILDAIRYNKPFICTKEVGILDRIKDIGIFVDPLNEKEIENAVIKLLNKEEYGKWRQKVKNFNFIHTWEEIADEIINVWKHL
ncbi:MAG: hypothetical protein A3H60_01940 [Candidatus Zambryskibacteria bacterium RIFCSPLOWO2_02_FULL_44_12b]|uniref:Glycosyl transferase family 1 domain-containing protein n=1 Tax=Candidatus Zambryskibacteria bacterium RIFCSPLOWO2_02_FULL_44_12b TaxID=1802772 RepID=A0A1G2UN97_9BACT|nr:MAG: hypothetical protein A3H60_01940 [Candidatus Zambryskibacteria bacterium RIFCSPLOWO2_02_FULL_44_12b]